MRLLYSDRFWNLKSPRLLISVTGGANLDIDPRLREIICKGIIRVASSTGKFI